MDWWRSFLIARRSHQVLRDGCLSDVNSILFGVPQGCVVGPVLFILYMVSGGARIFRLPGHSQGTKIYTGAPLSLIHI